MADAATTHTKSSLVNLPRELCNAIFAHLLPFRGQIELDAADPSKIIKTSSDTTFYDPNHQENFHHNLYILETLRQVNKQLQAEVEEEFFIRVAFIVTLPVLPLRSSWRTPSASMVLRNLRKITLVVKQRSGNSRWVDHVDLVRLRDSWEVSWETVGNGASSREERQVLIAMRWMDKNVSIIESLLNHESGAVNMSYGDLENIRSILTAPWGGS